MTRIIQSCMSAIFVHFLDCTRYMLVTIERAYNFIQYTNIQENPIEWRARYGTT
jgi:hypothetical protein